MAGTVRFSPALLAITVLAVVAGSAAGLLGVKGPSSSPVSFSTGNYTLPTFVLALLLLSPLLAMVLVAVISVATSGEALSGGRAAVAAVAIIGLVLVGLLLVFPPSARPALSTIGGVGGTGGSGCCGGSGNGSAGQGGQGGSGSGSGGGGSGTNTSGNGSSGSGGGSSGTGNGGQGGSGGTTGGSGNGSSGSGGSSGTPQNNSSASHASSLPPPTQLAWLLFAAAIVAAVTLTAVLVPQVATRLRMRSIAPTPPPGVVREYAATALSRARTELDRSSDPRSVIGRLYRELISHLPPIANVHVYRTPGEIRDAHLLPMGVRPVAAEQLTRLFEEASYSSHPIGPTELSRAREAIQMAEIDLRVVHAAG